jgi:hypothetical protein
MGLGLPGRDDFYHGRASQQKLDELLQAIEYSDLSL